MYLHEVGVDVVEVEEEREAMNREHLAFPHSDQLLPRLVISHRHDRVEENVLRARNGNATDDIVRAGVLVPFHGLGQLPPSLGKGFFPEGCSLESHSLVLLLRHCLCLLLTGASQHLHSTVDSQKLFKKVCYF